MIVVVTGSEARLVLRGLGPLEPGRGHRAAELLGHTRVRLVGQHGERRAGVHHHPAVPGAAHAPELGPGRDPRPAHRDRFESHRVEVRVLRVVQQRRVHEARLGGGVLTRAAS